MHSMNRTSLCSIRPLHSRSSPAHIPGPGRVNRPLPQQINRCGSDVDACYRIRVAAVAAGDTSEVCLRRSVGTGSVSAAGARPARAPGVHKNKADPGVLRLVRYLIEEVTERPGGHHPVKALGTTDPVTDPVKLLECEHGIRVPGGDVHKFFRELVVHVPHPAPLPAPRRLDPVIAPVGLVPAAQIGEVLPPVAYLLPVPDLHAFRRRHGGDAHHTEINTEDRRVTVTNGRCAGDAQGKHYVPFPSSLEEPCIAPDVPELLPPPGGDAKGQPYICTLSACGDTQDTVLNGVGVCPEAYALALEEHGLAGLSFGRTQPVVGPCELDGMVHRHPAVVGRKTEGPDGAVGRSVDLRPAARLHAESKVKAQLAALAEEPVCLVEPDTLPPGRAVELENNRFYRVHDDSIIRIMECVKMERKVL